MRRIAITLVAAGSLVLAAPTLPTFAQVSANADVSLNVSGIPNFIGTIRDFFRVPEQQVVIVQQAQVPQEQIPVVFYVAQQAHVPPATIVQLRTQGLSWNAITLKYGLSPEVYYVPVSETVVVGPPYGHAYGHFKNKPRSQWKTVVLSDADVINLVNLRVVATTAGVSPARVIQLRTKGQSFVVINDQVKPKKFKVHTVSQPKVKLQQVHHPKVKAPKVRQAQVKAAHKQVQAKVHKVHVSQMKVHNAHVSSPVKAQKAQHSPGGGGKDKGGKGH